MASNQLKGQVAKRLRGVPAVLRGPQAQVRVDTHVALVGFMGCGKSTVGKLLAERIGMPFVDLDDVIIENAGKSIPAIFRDHGEVGFRARERSALREVLKRSDPVVLATGGGTFADESMRQWLLKHARTIYLETTPDVLAARLVRSEARAKRPMLRGPDPISTIRRLLAERRGAYKQSELVVATDLATAEQVTEEIVRLLRPDTGAHAARNRRKTTTAPVQEETAAPRGGPLLRIHASTGSYPVELHADAGTWLSEAVLSLAAGQRVALITDSIVGPLHAKPLLNALTLSGKKCTLHTIEAGEQSKNLATVAELYDQLLDAGLARQDTVVAVGGGVVGDISGFVASTYLRGIGCIQVPTTTLAAVDSSVGGKTGVNTARGKNLVGTFAAPKAVLIAGAHLATQHRKAHAAGLAEVVKMAATLDAELFNDTVQQADALLKFDFDKLLPIISRAIALKADVVSRDEREQGERAVLNYGHTVGHAIETGSGYRILHGEAVALGMVAEAEWAEGEGAPAAVTQSLRQALRALDLPTEWHDCSVDVRALAMDKKRAAQGVRMPVIGALGSYGFKTVSVDALSAFVASRSQK